MLFFYIKNSQNLSKVILIIYFKEMLENIYFFIVEENRRIISKKFW